MPAHSETRKLPYSAQQMYDLVGDVARYPEFIPWIAASRVRSVTPEGDYAVMLADLVVGFKMFRERFLSRVTLWEDEQKIDTEYIEGPFHHLLSTWQFRDLPEGGCEVAFQVDFEFKNRILQGAAGLFFMEAMQRIVRAFETRAEALYGKGAA
ncbi:Putative oligoketide cyclase/dehydratase or lipid transport protein YfjG [Roseibacterium elongatum DSM 19469]|uniref:Putative oligoketide cyclase/dehydratase or lipid transport protein YfjG n=1 Tax=Roseicyclus elongatus DSM 19469 TaxID=1294273 RepID=W8RV80_9RHOB|nr:type II toxin-antitoxin system RatA family toxin [Roseibacterium elongatum]AHM05178.1 Putative oligoketide cyclase/dehydratase or lipid transport protein YfjG [Roseibacterium elongatum DSM 19469]